LFRFVSRYCILATISKQMQTKINLHSFLAAGAQANNCNVLAGQAVNRKESATADANVSLDFRISCVTLPLLAVPSLPRTLKYQVSGPFVRK